MRRANPADNCMDIDYEGSRREFLELLGQLDDPAFVRRARRVEETENGLRARCRAGRDELLRFPKLRLATVGAVVDFQWRELDIFFQDDDAADYLAALHGQWMPQLRSRVCLGGAAKIRRVLRELRRSFCRFNRKWKTFLLDVDLAPVNKARDDYNRYYVIEKSCAFMSERIGQRGFQSLTSFTLDDIVKELPYLRELDLQ